MPTTTERGYGRTHQQLRTQWQQTIDEVGATCHAVVCLMPTRAILQGSHVWDLGHTPDRMGYTGPEHPRCNRSEGSRRRAARVRAIRRRWAL